MLMGRMPRRSWIPTRRRVANNWRGCPWPERKIGQDAGATGRAKEFDRSGAIGRELVNAAQCDRVIAVSESEATLLRAL